MTEWRVTDRPIRAASTASVRRLTTSVAARTNGSSAKVATPMAASMTVRSVEVTVTLI